MKIVLSLPTLRHLEAGNFYICPILLDNDVFDHCTVAPLTTFRYIMSHYRHTLSFSSELATLDFMICHIHTSLENLVLPAECAPVQSPDNVFSALAAYSGPRTGEPASRGECWNDSAIPIFSLCAPPPKFHPRTLRVEERKR